MPTLTELTTKLSAEDYEERRLVETYLEHSRRLRTGDEGVLGAEKLSSAARRELEAKVQTTILKLGYDPTSTRPAKPRGRPRDASLPRPLPPIGTVLRNLFGEEYRVSAYLRRPCTHRDADPDMIVYWDDMGKAVVRSVIGLFCGSLAGIPLVTWPEDSRGFKPGEPIAAHKARTRTPAQLRQQRLEMDADYQQDLASRKSGRRY